MYRHMHTYPLENCYFLLQLLHRLASYGATIKGPEGGHT